MDKQAILPPNVLRQLLSYCPETGVMTWQRRDVYMFSNENGRAENACGIWNSRYAGRQAFTAVSKLKGYLVGSIFNFKFLAHRVAWALETGLWPENQIDHINGCRTDNRFSNLRDVLPLQNSQNMKMPKSNTSGYMGVSRKQNGWSAQLRAEGRVHLLGTFCSFDEAVAAHRTAAKSFGFHENHGRQT